MREVPDGKRKGSPVLQDVRYLDERMRGRGRFGARRGEARDARSCAGSAPAVAAVAATIATSYPHTESAADFARYQRKLADKAEQVRDAGRLPR